MWLIRGWLKRVNRVKFMTWLFIHLQLVLRENCLRKIFVQCVQSGVGRKNFWHLKQDCTGLSSLIASELLVTFQSITLKKLRGLLMFQFQSCLCIISTSSLVRRNSQRTLHSNALSSNMRRNLRSHLHPDSIHQFAHRFVARLRSRREDFIQTLAA